MKKTSLISILLLPVIALAVYAGAILWLKGPLNPWDPTPPLVQTPPVELVVPQGVRFVDVIEVEIDHTKQSAALLADPQGRTVLLPQKPEIFAMLPEPERLAVSVLSQYQHRETFGQVASTTQRFKNTKTGEFREFSPNQYPSSGDWVPVGK